MKKLGIRIPRFRAAAAFVAALCGSTGGARLGRRSKTGDASYTRPTRMGQPRLWGRKMLPGAGHTLCILYPWLRLAPPQHGPGSAAAIDELQTGLRDSAPAGCRGPARGGNREPERGGMDAVQCLQRGRSGRGAEGKSEQTARGTRLQIRRSVASANRGQSPLRVCGRLACHSQSPSSRILLVSQAVRRVRLGRRCRLGPRAVRSSSRQCYTEPAAVAPSSARLALQSDVLFRPPKIMGLAQSTIPAENIRAPAIAGARWTPSV